MAKSYTLNFEHFLITCDDKNRPWLVNEKKVLPLFWPSMVITCDDKVWSWVVNEEKALPEG